MSKSIFIKVLICIIFIVILSNTFCLPVSHAGGDIFSQGRKFLNDGNSIDNTLNITELKSTSNYIYNILLGVAIMVAIVVSMVLGIQFMAASADEKAKVKEALLPFGVGLVVVFGAFTIWKIAVNIGNDAESSIGSSTQLAPGIDGYICTYCDSEIGEIPAGVITGGRDYVCPNCHEKIVEKGTITNAKKQE